MRLLQGRYANNSVFKFFNTAAAENTMMLLGGSRAQSPPKPMNIMRSSEIEEMNDDALATVVERIDIFTRVNPAQKKPDYECTQI